MLHISTGTLTVYEHDFLLAEAGGSTLQLPPNPSWESKYVDCTYALGPDLQAALAASDDFAGCSGPLMSVIRG